LTRFSFLINLIKFSNSIQLSVKELKEVCSILHQYNCSNMLVFGLGNDSTFWRLMNKRGRTVFIEDNPWWKAEALKYDKYLEIILTTYNTSISQWKELIAQPQLLELELPLEISEHKWNIILVDAPTGYDSQSTGRMKSIYMSSVLISSPGHIFVHDCNREVEQEYCDHYLKNTRLIKEIEIMREYKF